MNEVERVVKKSLFKIILERNLKTGAQCELEIDFSGKLYNDTSEALFRSSYRDTISGELKWFLASYFRPNLARRVFPCFDEPHFKTSFSLKVARLENMITLSNMPRDISEPMQGKDGWYWDTFQTTPPMSTFTLGLTISELKYLEPIDGTLTRKRLSLNLESR